MANALIAKLTTPSSHSPTRCGSGSHPLHGNTTRTSCCILTLALGVCVLSPFSVLNCPLCNQLAHIHCIYTPVTFFVCSRSCCVPQVVIYDCFRPGDLVTAEVLSLGDARSYYLSTAKNELGVVYARGGAGGWVCRCVICLAPLLCLPPRVDVFL